MRDGGLARFPGGAGEGEDPVLPVALAPAQQRIPVDHAERGPRAEHAHRQALLRQRSRVGVALQQPAHASALVRVDVHLADAERQSEALRGRAQQGPRFVHPDELGAGRFASIGLPFSQQLAPLVGGIEIGAGVMVILNFYAGDAALLLLAVILAALVTTKVPILLGRPLGPFALAKLPHYGWLSFLHEARTDLCMVAGTLAVLIDSGLRVGRRRQWYQSEGL